MGITDQAESEEFRNDRSHFSVVRLTDPDDAVACWLTRPPIERLQALKLLRRTFYGYTSATEGLQRVLKIAQLIPK